MAMSPEELAGLLGFYPGQTEGIGPPSGLFRGGGGGGPGSGGMPLWATPSGIMPPSGPYSSTAQVPMGGKGPLGPPGPGPMPAGRAGVPMQGFRPGGGMPPPNGPGLYGPSGMRDIGGHSMAGSNIVPSGGVLSGFRPTGRGGPPNMGTMDPRGGALGAGAYLAMLLLEDEAKRGGQGYGGPEPPPGTITTEPELSGLNAGGYVGESAPGGQGYGGPEPPPGSIALPEGGQGYGGPEPIELATLIQPQAAPRAPAGPSRGEQALTQRAKTQGQQAPYNIQRKSSITRMERTPQPRTPPPDRRQSAAPPIDRSPMITQDLDYENWLLGGGPLPGGHPRLRGGYDATQGG